MEFLIPLMPFFAALPVAVAAVLIAKIWRRRQDLPTTALETQNQELRAELDALRDELHEAQERLDFTQRVLAQQRRVNPLPPTGDADRLRQGE